jgi:hypothetical protein
MGIAGEQLYLDVALGRSTGRAALYEVEHPLLSVHHGSEFGENHPAYCQ